MGTSDRSKFYIESEEIARSFHTVYEKYAPDHIPQRESRSRWEELPVENKLLMISVVKKLILDGVIESGKTLSRSVGDQ